jgi:translation initiation factor 3 subunit D
MAADKKPSFQLPAIDDSPDGWGPSTLPKQFSDMPYAPFEKRAFLGRMADWSARAEQYRERYRNQNRQAPVANEAFAQEADDVAGFNLVDTTKVQQQPGWDKGMRGRYGRGRGGRFGGRGGGRFGAAQQPMGAEAKFNANFLKKKMPTAPVSKWRKNQQNNQGFRWQDQKPQRIRDASVDVRPDWVVQGQITFAELQKMTVEPPTAEEVEACGTLRYYDKQFDRITPKTEKKLVAKETAFFKVSTSDDPVVTKLVEGDAKAVSDVRVFATDAVLAVLMAAPRSAFSWDIVVNRVGDKLFLDKRAGSSIDYVTCNETANDFGDEEKESINHPTKLTSEATYINQNFSQQVLSEMTHPFSDPNNPFAASTEEAAVAAPVGYRYRKFELGAPPKGDAADTRVKLLCRCELDGVIKGKQDEDLFLRLYALNEIDAKLVNGIDWRQKLESQRGAVLATELKNNSNKLAKWTLQAMLAGADLIKLGYVSRVHAKDSFNHVILGTQQYKPKEFAQHINLNVSNAWGILKAVIDLCLGLEEGKFLLMKDPNKQVIRLYSIPVDAFDVAEPEDEEGEEGAEDED